MADAPHEAIREARRLRAELELTTDPSLMGLVTQEIFAEMYFSHAAKWEAEWAREDG